MSSQTIKITASGPGYLIAHGSCCYLADWLPQVPDWDAPDLVFCSPPYEDARTYGLGFNYEGWPWVLWALERYVQCLEVCSGLVAWVVEGRTRNFKYSATPYMMMNSLHRMGYGLRKPPIFQRVGVPGSGGPDWLRNDYEHIICATRKPGRLPWSDNTAMGHPPKYKPGGNPSHRKQDGSRVRGRAYKPPKLANPGNVIACGAAGGGNIGSELAHENEAPFPEALAEFFICSFCPPGGIVLDPFSGSGTTAAVALRCGRRAIAIDIRESQCALTLRRIKEVLAEKEADHATT